MNELIKLQELIGLSERESKTYLALSKLGKTTTGPLSKESSVPSSKIYSVLSSLESKGLSSHITIGKTKYFSPEEPKKILSIFNEKQNSVKNLVSEIEKKRAEKNPVSKVRLYEGLKAIRNLLIEKSENAGNELWMGLSNGENLHEEKIADFYEWWGAQKTYTNLNNINIISKRNEPIFRERYKKHYKEMKGHFFFAEHYLPHDVAIIKNDVIILHMHPSPIAVLITNPLFAKHYKKFFNDFMKDSTKF